MRFELFMAGRYLRGRGRRMFSGITAIAMGGVFVGVAAILIGGFFLLVLALVWGLLVMFTEDFAVPVMYLRRCRVLAAWREVWGLLSANPGAFALYVLFKMVIGMAVGTIAMLVFCATCCCLAILPFLWAVVLLPLFVFVRSYSLYFLGQFHPGYQLLPVVADDGPQGLA